MRIASFAQLIGHRLQGALGHAADFCYPGVCANCDAASPGGAILCGECTVKLAALVDAASCDRCAMPLSAPGAPCPYCQGRGMRPFERMLGLGVFEDPLKHVIHLAKYHRRWPLAEILADRLVASERVKGLLTETDVLVPVPLHRRRQLLRGYNQADVIARRISKVCGIKVINAAKRIRSTETQTHLHSQEKRAANVRGAFALRPAARQLVAKHVVIVDDVMTTGSTLRELGRLLKHAAPASLSTLVLAVADPRGRGFEAI